jgi:hypothetical protein
MPKEKRNPCPVPGCEYTITDKSDYGVCSQHEKQFTGITFYMSQVNKALAAIDKKRAEPKKTGLYLP